jgi:hypothetical protein
MPTTIRRGPFRVLALALAVLVAGCGSSPSAKSAPSLASDPLLKLELRNPSHIGASSEAVARFDALHAARQPPDAGVELFRGYGPEGTAIEGSEELGHWELRANSRRFEILGNFHLVYWNSRPSPREIDSDLRFLATAVGGDMVIFGVVYRDATRQRVDATRGFVLRHRGP